MSQIQILATYQQRVEQKELQYDQAQLTAVNTLQSLAESLVKKRVWWQTQPQVQGVYLHGPVGRGKSMLMDLFYQQLPIENKQRLHFHHFMAQVHQQLNSLQGAKNPLIHIAAQWAKKIRVLCFDEFFVSDIGDAMIMAELFKALFNKGVVLVATSNCHPEQLYYNGLQRGRFLPTIELLKAHCILINVTGEVDHRLRFGQHATYYFDHGSGEQQFQANFFAFSRPLLSDNSVAIKGRTLRCLQHSSNAIMFDFMALCSGPRSTADYIYLAQHYQRVYVCNIPVMGAQATGKQIVHGIEDSYQREKQVLQEHTLDDEARRFIALVDEFYDRGKLLVISAQDDISQLYRGKKLAFEYARTESRLIEMQNW